jgi:multiple sugar transport system substrate-binding protein
MRGIKGSLVGAVALGAIGSTAVAAAQELTFRYNFDNIDEIRAGLDEFERRNPGITVNLERIAFKDARDQFIREAATGGGPDVVHLAFVWIKDLGEAGACMQLNDLVAEKGIGEVGWEDFIATDLTYGEDGESFYGVPYATDTWAMVYNTEIMAEAGIEKVPETWDELLEASRKVKAARSASVSPPAPRAPTPSGSCTTSTGGRTVARWWSTTARAATRSASRPSRWPA